MTKQEIYVLHRVVVSEDDGYEEQTPMFFKTFTGASNAAAKWMADVEDMLEQNCIEYSKDYENWTISSGEDRWEVYITKDRVEE